MPSTARGGWSSRDAASAKGAEGSTGPDGPLTASPNSQHHTIKSICNGYLFRGNPREDPYHIMRWVAVEASAIAVGGGGGGGGSDEGEGGVEKSSKRWGRNTIPLANFAGDGGLRTLSERFRAIKMFYIMNVYDSNAETEGRK